jgi:translation initiation factor 1
MTRLFAGTPFDIPPRCDRCGELEQDCKCGPPEHQWTDPSKQSVKVRVDRRKHKRMATVVWGLDPSETDLRDLLSKLQSACGSGGSVQADEIELQGDHADRVRAELQAMGYTVLK